MLFLHTSFFFLLCALTSVQARPLAAPSPFRDGIVLFEYPSGSEVEVESGNSLAKSPAPIIWEPETSQDDKDTDSNPPILARPGRERKHSGKSTHTKDPSKGHKGKKGHITKTKVVEVTRTVDDVGGIPVSTPCVTSTTTTVEVAPVPVEETTSTPCTKVEEIVETSTSTPCETSTTIAPVVEQPVPSSTPCETTEAPAPVEEPTSTSTPCDTTVTMIVVPIPVETTTTPCDTTTAIQAPVEETTSTPCNTTPVETTSTPCDTTTTQTPVEETTTTPLPITTVSEDPTSITTLPDSSTTTPESPSTTTIPTTESPTLTTTPTPPPPASTETVLPGEIPTLSFVLLPQESSSTTSDTFTIRPTPTAPLSPSSPTTTTTTTSSDSTTTPTTTTTPTLDSDNSITTPDAITQNPKLEIPTPIISNGNIDLDQFNDFLATQLAQTETNAAATQKPVACLGCGDTITRPIEGAGVGRGGMLMRRWLTGVVVVVGMVAMW